MDFCYRLFYISLSLSIVSVFLVPFVIILRFFFRNLPRKYVVILWGLFFLRAVCPVGMSSPFSILAGLNRQFHLMQQNFGLEQLKEYGLMTSWIQIFTGAVSPAFPYKICTIIWILGAVSVLFIGMRHRHRLKRKLKAVRLYDTVYQSSAMNTPLYLGIFQVKRYFPETMTAEEIKNVLDRKEMLCAKCYRWLRMGFRLVLAFQWYQPFLWAGYFMAAVDMNLAEDEAYVERAGGVVAAKKHAQNIVNMNRGEGKVSFSFFVDGEMHLSKRAEHMLYWKGNAVTYQRITAAVILFLCLTGWFGQSYLRTLWNGSVWGDGAKGGNQEELFENGSIHEVSDKVIASANTRTLEGISMKIQLVVSEGTYQRGIGYQGNCRIDMADSRGNVLDTLPLSELFRKEIQYFSNDISLVVQDYNQDGTGEISIGQRVEASVTGLNASGGAISVSTGAGAGDKKKMYQFYLLNAGDKGLKVVSESVYQSKVTSLQTGSMLFSCVERSDGIITTHLEGNPAYYVWNKNKHLYQREDMTEKELEARIQKERAKEGEAEEFNLTDENGKSMVRVDTRTDDTGSKLIDKVVLAPEGFSRAFEDINGYYCQIEWVNLAEEETGRYAVLTYNGTASRTFVIFDVKQKKITYEHEDGIRGLGQLFAESGEEEFTFEEKGMAVYNLLEMKQNNILLIGFAANADQGIAISGNYEYRIKEKKAYQLSFTREER